jgi:hypothetical protein
MSCHLDPDSGERSAARLDLIPLSVNNNFDNSLNTERYLLNTENN